MDCLHLLSTKVCYLIPVVFRKCVPCDKRLVCIKKLNSSSFLIFFPVHLIPQLEPQLVSQTHCSKCWRHWVTSLRFCIRTFALVCVCAWVSEWEAAAWGWEGCRWTACEGQQFRGPVLRITWQPCPIRGYAQMNLLSKWVNQAREGGGEWVFLHMATAAPVRPVCLSARISHSRLSPLCHRLFTWSLLCCHPHGALCIALYFSLPPPIPALHSLSCNTIVLLENSLFLSWIRRLCSQCFDGVLSSYTGRQWIVKETVKTDWASAWNLNTSQKYNNASMAFTWIFHVTEIHTVKKVSSAFFFQAIFSWNKHFR